MYSDDSTRMLMSRFNVVLWHYPPTVPTERLVRHYRIFGRLTRLWLWSVVALMGGLCQFLLFKSTLEMVLALVATGVSLLVAIPAIVSQLWLGDIERILQERGVALADVRVLERDSDAYFRRMMLWLVALILVIAFLSSGK